MTASSSPTVESKRRLGLVGFGSLGQFLLEKIEKEASDIFDIAFIWNRTVSNIPENIRNGNTNNYTILEDLSQFAEHSPDIIVEVAHPSISIEFGEQFLQYCDYYMGSPTAMADQDTNMKLQKLGVDPAIKGTLYIPVGALWGAEDIQRMADRNTLKRLSIAMKKHPSSLKLTPPLSEKLQPENLQKGVENYLYKGPVRGLCPLAPNNVNTMACAAIAGHNLGFDNVEAALVADDRLEKEHIIEIEVEGPNGFTVKTSRINPAAVGAVTGAQTYVSFFNSLLKARGRGTGVFFC